MKTTPETPREPSEVLVSTSFFPANQYNVGSYIREVFFDRDLKVYQAFAIQGDAIIAQSAAETEFQCCMALSDSIRALRKQQRAAA